MSGSEGWVFGSPGGSVGCRLTHWDFNSGIFNSRLLLGIDEGIFEGWVLGSLGVGSVIGLPTGIIYSRDFLLLIPVWAFISYEVGYSCQAWKGGFVGLSGVRLVIRLPTGNIHSKKVYTFNSCLGIYFMSVGCSCQAWYGSNCLVLLHCILI